MKQKKYKAPKKLELKKEVKKEPTYAMIITKQQAQPTIEVSEPKVYNASLPTHPKKQSKNRCMVEYETWTRLYFTHLIKLRDIFIKGINSTNDYYYTVGFFNQFCRLIYDKSSGKIQNHLEPLTEDEENDYFDLFIEIHS